MTTDRYTAEDWRLWREWSDYIRDRPWTKPRKGKKSKREE